MAIPIVTPAGPLAREGKTLTAFLSDQPVAWTATGGVLSAVTANSASWEAPNLAGEWQVRATNGGAEQRAVVVVVKAVIPNYWTFQNPITARKTTLTFTPYFGPTQQRGFGDNRFIHDWELSNPGSELERFKELKAFWDWHYGIGLPFDLIDPVLRERRTYKADSDLAYNYTPAGFVAWSGRIKEEYPYVVIPA